MANIARLGVVLGIDSAEFVRGIEAAGKKLEALSNAIEKYGKVAATALVAASYAALRYADEIADVAKANDVAIDSVVKLQNALANSGGKAENAGKLLSSFTASIDKAAEGSFETQKVFKTLGVSLEDLGKLNIDELFKATVASLAEMDDPITRNAKAMELFGKAAKGVDFVELNNQLQAANSLTSQQAQSIEAAAASYDLLGQAARDVALIIGVELGTPLKESIYYIKQISGETNILGEIFRTVFQTVAVLGANLEFVFSGIAREIKHTLDNAKLLAALDFKGATALNEKFAAENERRREALNAFEARIMGVVNAGAGRGFINPEAPAVAAAVAPIRAIIPGVDKEAKKATQDYMNFLNGVNDALLDRRKKIDDEIKKIDKEQVRRYMEIFEAQQSDILESNTALANQATLFQNIAASEFNRQARNKEDLIRQRQMLDLLHNSRDLKSEELEFEKEKLQIEWQRKDAIEQISNLTLKPEEREAALRRENELAREAVELARKRLEYANKEREGTAAEGFMSAAGRAFRDAKTDFEMGQQAFESVIGNMESAILRFVQTGKFSFKDLARSIIADLIAMQLKAQALSIFKMILKSIGGGAGPEGAEEYMYNPPGRAAGGPVGADTMYMVGERGPELFVPQSAGTIIPNNSMASMMAGGQTVNYNGPVIQNMSAIDTQSGIQFLAKNKNTIWAANQSAQRSLPMSR